MGKKHPTNIGHLDHILLIDEKSTVISVTDTLLKNKIEMTLKCAIFLICYAFAVFLTAPF